MYLKDRHTSILGAIMRNYDGKEATDNSIYTRHVLSFLKNLNWCVRRSSYMLLLSYGLEGKAIIIAFLWPAEFLVASKEC